MKIRRLKVSRFRGIKELEWNLGGSTACLIGPGDSTKSTILSAIEYCLYPGWGLQILDTDFFDQDVSAPIEISIVVGDLASSIISDDELGMALKGYDQDAGILEDEPGDGLERVVEIHFRVSGDLDPEWFMLQAGSGEKRPLGSKRRLFKVVRLTERVDSDLGWTRNSALSRLTMKQSGTSSHIPEVYRAANAEFDGADIDAFKTAASEVESSVRDFGIEMDNLIPGLLQSSFLARGGAIGLYQGKIPLLQKGLGTKRLVALAMQMKAVTDHAIVLVDEIETGLEPFRIEAVLRNLGCFEEQKPNQLIFTTHSPTPLIKLDAESLYFVRSANGKIDVRGLPRPVASEFRSMIRKCGVALFAKKIVVGEGPTEFGLIRGFFAADSRSNEHGLMFFGADVVPGGGSDAPKVALLMRKLGYGVFLLADSDRPISPNKATLIAAGVSVHLWADNVATESRLFADLPNGATGEMLAYAVAIHGIHGIAHQLSDVAAGEARFDASIAKLIATPQPSSFDSTDRELLGKAACSKYGWFKNVDGGEFLGDLLARNFNQIAGTPTRQGLDELISWLAEVSP